MLEGQFFLGLGWFSRILSIFENLPDLDGNMGRTLCQYWTRHFSLSVKPLDPIWVRRLTRQKSIFKNCSIVDTIGTESSVISIILIDLLRTKYWYGYHFDQEKILNNPSSFTVKWSASKWCQKYSIIFNLITVYQPKHGQVEPNKTLICNKTAYQGKYSLFQYSLSVDLKSLWKFSVCLQFYRIIGEKSIISNLFKKINWQNHVSDLNEQKITKTKERTN